MTVPLTHANGAAHPHPPSTINLVPVGPVSRWPRVVLPTPPPAATLLPIVALPRQSPPAPNDAVRNRRPGAILTVLASARRALDGGTAIRLTATLAVLGVAAIAAVVSYSHIYDLAVAHHESGTAARLLPVSVDGLIVSASMTLLNAARKLLTASPVAYLMLWLGVGATVAANVAFGLPWGWQSAVVAAWPAVAFVGSVEMALTLARDQRRAASGDDGRRLWRFWRRRNRAQTPPDDGATPPPPPPVRPPGSRRPGRRPRKTPARQPMTGGSKLAAAKALLDKTPAMTVTELMAAGVSEGTARRAKKEQAGP